MRRKLYRLTIPLFVAVLIFIFGGPLLAQTLTQEQAFNGSMIY
jgi:hypothetical protein